MTRYTDQPTFNIQLIWNPNTLRGFIGALIIVSIVLSMSLCTDLRRTEEIIVHRPPPIVLLRLGSGDGTGARKGNLTAEGASQKGKEADSPLADAQKSAGNSTTGSADLSQSSNVVTAPNAGKSGANAPNASDEHSIGKSYADQDGTGLGSLGMGKGKGDGFGNIDWGGGGDRTVKNKIEPAVPPNSQGAVVTVRFRVAPDGSVISCDVVRKAKREIDQAVVSALRRWKFSTLQGATVMEGTITFRVRR